MGFVIKNGVLKKYNGRRTRSIVVPDGVRSIAGFAFSECPMLTEIVIPESVTSLEYEALCCFSKELKIYINFDLFENYEKISKSYWGDKVSRSFLEEVGLCQGVNDNAWTGVIRGFLSRYASGDMDETENSKWKSYISKRTAKVFRCLGDDPVLYRYLTENDILSSRRVETLLEKVTNVECRVILLNYGNRRKGQKKKPEDNFNKTFGLEE